MTKEDKLLLVKDLSSRLPYGVEIEHIKSGMRGVLHELNVYPVYDDDDNIFDCICNTDFFGDGDSFDISEFKPYLFPLSSMTEEQYKYISYNFGRDGLDYIKYGTCDFHSSTLNIEDIYELVDWLNKNHFDYRGLIEKGLALDATNKNIYN